MARIETKAGHGAGKPTAKVIEELVDVFCFMAKALNYKFIDWLKSKYRTLMKHTQKIFFQISIMSIERQQYNL